jgi:hypothetical protein
VCYDPKNTTYVVNTRVNKVKASMCLIKHHAINTYGEWRYSSTHSEPWDKNGGEWAGGWLGPRACLQSRSGRGDEEKQFKSYVKYFNPILNLRSGNSYKTNYMALGIY